MKIYVTRHGQVALQTEYINGDVNLPKGETVLSSMGREQATLLGKMMKKMNFRGKILCSPLIRTMETAELVAREVDAPIYPAPWIHEIFPQQEFLDQYEGPTLEQLQTLFPHVAPDAELVYPWWPKKAENHEDVKARVIPAIDELLKQKDSDEEILLVGHGASAGAANIYLNLKRNGYLFNCCLGLYDTKNPDRNFGKNICFLPGNMVSNNRNMAMDLTFPEDCTNPFGIEIPQELRESKGFKLLHIGDTHSGTYPFYCQLIKQVKPDVIIHTGDTADELKVGWDVSAWDTYTKHVQILFDCMKESGSKAYWVPGNNDLPDKIAEIAPFAEIVQPNTVLEIEGQRICVSHSREQIDNDADIYLYGHGCRLGETFEEELYASGPDRWHLNALRNSYGILLPEKKLFVIERPD